MQQQRIRAQGGGDPPPPTAAHADTSGQAAWDKRRINLGWRLGVMAAVCRGARSRQGHQVIGNLPGSGGPDAAKANLDVVAVFTGMGQVRNVINVLSADEVVVCGGGGAGTASEAAPLKAGRWLTLLAAPEPWQGVFAHLDPAVITAADLATCCWRIKEMLGDGSRQAPAG